MSPKLAPALALLSLGLAAVATPSQPAPARSAPAASQKPVLTTLHRFDKKYGSRPPSSPTPDADGNFYGVTQAGGSQNFGTVYKITPNGQFTTLHVFKGTDGHEPQASLVQGKDGAFYGTTQEGGPVLAGSVFRITSNGQFTNLHTFTRTDGAYPRSALVLAPDGSFYGTTAEGGVTGDYGAIFHMSVNGTITTLHMFSNKDGYLPSGNLVLGLDGTLYGTTGEGGSRNGGTVYRLTTDGAFSVLHNFAYDGGGVAFAGLTVGPDGALYGVTDRGGINSFGTAYKIMPSGVFTTLHNFSNDGHGANPFAALTLGADGNFYGTTVDGGTNNAGTVFVMTPAGQVTTLYKFHTAFDGRTPYAGVVFGSDSALYGVTYGGGGKKQGTIYKLTLP